MKDTLPAKQNGWQNKWWVNEIFPSAFPYNKMWTWLKCIYKVYTRLSLIISQILFWNWYWRPWRTWLKTLPHSNHEKKTPATLRETAYVANYYLWGWCPVELDLLCYSSGPAFDVWAWMLGSEHSQMKQWLYFSKSMLEKEQVSKPE